MVLRCSSTWSFDVFRDPHFSLKCVNPDERHGFIVSTGGTGLGHSTPLKDHTIKEQTHCSKATMRKLRGRSTRIIQMEDKNVSNDRTVVRQTDERGQRVSGAPAPGLSAPSAMNNQLNANYSAEKIAEADSRLSVLVLLDLSVNHQILQSILSLLAITLNPLHWFESYLTGDPTVAARILSRLADIWAWMKEPHLQLNLAKTERLVFPATPLVEIRLCFSPGTDRSLVLHRKYFSCPYEPWISTEQEAAIRMTFAVWVTPAPGTAKTTMSSLPEESPLKQSSSSSLTHKEPLDLKIYQLSMLNGSICGTESHKEVDDGVFIIKMIGSKIFYKNFYEMKPTLEYLPYRFQNIKNYDVKLNNLNNSNNDIFNQCFKDLDKCVQDCITGEVKKQIAFVFFRNKDGSLAKSRTKVIKLKPKEHTEDEVFSVMQDIFNESHCDYSEIYIFSTNSPCLARINCVPCMIRMFFWAYHLNTKHGIKIIIGYIKNYGLNGSFDNNILFKPIRDVIYDSQKSRIKDIISSSPPPHKKTKKGKDFIKALIAEEENEPFPMGARKYKPPSCDLKNNFEEIDNANIYSKLNKIKLNLFKIPKLDERTFDDFNAYASHMFEENSKEVRDLLINYDERISAKVIKSLQTLFFTWWAKNLEESSSKFLNQKVNHKLKNYALHLSLMEIEEIQKDLGSHFFEIGVVTFN